MNFKTFSDLLFSALSARDYNEFLKFAKEEERFSEEMMTTGVLFRIWLYSVDRSSTKIREFTGMTRAQFCRTYRLPERTVTNWDAKKTFPPDWMLDYLCFAVLTDLHSIPTGRREDSEEDVEEETLD